MAKIDIAKLVFIDFKPYMVDRQDRLYARGPLGSWQLLGKYYRP